MIIHSFILVKAIIVIVGSIISHIIIHYDIIQLLYSILVMIVIGSTGLCVVLLLSTIRYDSIIIMADIT